MTHVSSHRGLLHMLRMWWHHVVHRSDTKVDAAHEFDEFFNK